jgi:hypothetical protein
MYIYNKSRSLVSMVRSGVYIMSLQKCFCFHVRIIVCRNVEGQYILLFFKQMENIGVEPGTYLGHLTVSIQVQN